MQNLPVNTTYFGSDKDFRALLPRYFAEEVAGNSDHTIRAKAQDLKKFIRFYQDLNGRLDAADWTVRDTKLFIDALARDGYKPATVNRILASVRSFGRWLREIGAIRLDPAKGIRELALEPIAPKSITDVDYHRLQKAADLLSRSPASTTSQGVRDAVLIELLNASGLRISEVLSLRVDQLQGKKLVGVRCKGGKIRDVLIRHEVADFVRDLIQRRNAGVDDLIFTNRYGERLSRTGVAKALNKIAGVASASLPLPIKVSPHRFRHRHAYACRQKKDLLFAAKRLGHSNLKYLERYTTLGEKEEAAILDDL